MPRPKKKQINLSNESVLSLLQEIYNECVEQRNTAIRIQNKMLGFMQEAADLQLLGPVIKEQQKIIDASIEKKIQLSKVQTALMQKTLTSNEESEGLSLDVRESINKLITQRAEEDKEDSTNTKK
jgi:hypothetical protein|tara:strand:- start:426 stop:800 length:375 start_codon:yes stop_codon:yes gene_type:complete